MSHLNGQPPSPRLTQFQALITGSILGALMNAEHLLIDVAAGTDESGENFSNEVFVRGRESGERLVVRIEVAE